MKTKRRKNVVILSGADGPTSIFLAGKRKRLSLIEWFKDWRNQRKQKKIKKTITVNPHSMKEVIRYAKAKYHAVELTSDTRNFIEVRRSHKEGLVFLKRPDPEDELPMDFHLYKIRKGNEEIEMAVDFYWNILNISHQGNRKTWKQGEEIVKDLYRYYSVTRKDVEENSERYKNLVRILSE
ncbi:hypothetical protein [Sellimonas catena]|uniref:Uncharacterized protein n=1 Tax=Sellimonas catena TaxID=2994035 RepID=A0A9W6CGV6_9FIRM|nr:hypothetical protein [Sellimonas catena]GLG91142.1 hypothetical protein Selli2_25690 [Sellimonas catena]